jgi:hypothetical protein
LLSRFFKTPSTTSVQPIAPQSVVAAEPAQTFLEVPGNLNFFHITHWKAGSQWMAALLRNLYGKAIVPAENFEQQVLSKPILPGKVYSCVYLSKPEFDTLTIPSNSRRMVLIRDLRDTLVSAYFSVRYSHVVDNPLMERRRNALTRLDQEQGLIYLMEMWLNGCAMIQRSWISSGEPVFRLEDCMVDPKATLTNMFKNGWGMMPDAEKLDKAIAANSFEKLSGGRERGKEDIQAHYRKGSAGDWRNHFTPAITKRFKVLYQDALVAGGYEKDENW